MKVCEGAVIFLLGLSAFAANVVAPTKAELETMYAAAARDANAGNYPAALHQLDAIDARQPDMAAAHNLRGVVLMRLADYARAERALRKAREIDPDFWEARFNLAEVPFLRKSWGEARHRFEELASAKSEQAQGPTGDLIQFKVLLTYLMEGKEKKAREILDQLQTSSESPGYYYGKAAFAFRKRDQTNAKVALKAAEKSFAPRLNTLFVESFYEVGWMEKPEGAISAALEVDSLAERVTRAQADFRKAEQAYRHLDYEDALQLLDHLDATAPNQAVSYNLRGKILLAQGEIDAAEAALHNALVADPQFEEARYNLARIPFKKGDFEAARKQLEELLGAISGGKQSRQREQLIKYQIFLTLLLQNRDGPAQKAMDEFKLMDDTPALYYAQAAWAFRHGNTTQGNAWVANAGNLFPEDLSQAFAAPFADLGWLSKPAAAATATPASLAAGPTPVPPQITPSAAGSPVETPVVVARTDKSKALATPEASPEVTPAAAAASPLERPVVVAQSDKPNATATPEVSPEVIPVTTTAPTATPAALAQNDEPNDAATPRVAATPQKIASEKKSNPSGSPADRTRTNLKPRATESGDSARSNRKSARTGAAKPAEAVRTPAAAEMVEPPRQKFGEKLANFFSYPFRHASDQPPRPAFGVKLPTKSASPQPTPR